jgi:hypothetical protein
MSVLIVGAQGSMGKRYQCILDYLQRPYICVDKIHTLAEIKRDASRASGIIIATPTNTHVNFIREFLPFRKPILCEKPITKDIAELKDLKDEILESKTPFRMTFQYEVLDQPSQNGPSRYNYFRHGNDGLVWDCLQIIGLARSEIKLGEDSPVWSCMMNGKALSLSHMDAAYIAYLQKWFHRPDDSLSKIVQVHEKTAEYQNGFY